MTPVEMWVCVCFLHGRSSELALRTTVGFLERVDVAFSTSQQNTKTNVMKPAERAIRCTMLTHIRILLWLMWGEKWFLLPGRRKPETHKLMRSEQKNTGSFCNKMINKQQAAALSWYRSRFIFNVPLLCWSFHVPVVAGRRKGATCRQGQTGHQHKHGTRSGMLTVAHFRWL